MRSAPLALLSATETQRRRRGARGLGAASDEGGGFRPGRGPASAAQRNPLGGSSSVPQAGTCPCPWGPQASRTTSQPPAGSRRTYARLWCVTRQSPHVDGTWLGLDVGPLPRSCAPLASRPARPSGAGAGPGGSAGVRRPKAAAVGATALLSLNGDTFSVLLFYGFDFSFLEKLQTFILKKTDR